ncbi:hypothetical protein BDZ89DRAFT_1041237 [Hymenopellis radicata]|nr:hypothetical protein BDZ89DRAFT_1041234 [Hymenopellis radicata]KAF9024190.1 hypothetical protein BDZ89DRAFT_1041237 [Hymenopellis radicata]
MRASEGNQDNDRAPNYTRKDTSGGDLNSIRRLSAFPGTGVTSATRRAGTPFVCCNYNLYAAPTPQGRKRLVATLGVALIGVLAQFVEIRCQNLDKVEEVGSKNIPKTPRWRGREDGPSVVNQIPVTKETRNERPAQFVENRD